MGDSVSDDEFDIGTAGEIPVVRAEQLIEPNNELGKGPCSESEPICEPNNEPIKEPISEPVSEITNEVSVSDEYALSLMQDLPRNYLKFELQGLETTTLDSEANDAEVRGN